MKIKNYLLYAAIVLIIASIFLMIILSNANEPLDKYEKHDLKTEKHVSFNGGHTFHELYENKLASQNHKDAKKKYGVATNNKIARDVGNKIIQEGGNSADAAYGVAYTLAVTEPYAAGLGGEGTSLTYDGKKGSKPTVYDYNTVSGYNYQKGDEVGVPGFVQGMHDMHEKEGHMSEKKILNYVIPLAEDGFQVNTDLAKLLSKYSGNLDNNSPFFKKEDQVVQNGDVVKRCYLRDVTSMNRLFL